MRKQAAVRQLDVLDVLTRHEKPMTAYAILNQMKTAEPSLAAPTVYRTLAALTEQGRAHKLESMNAFVACRCAHDASVPVLAICNECGAVEEHDGAAILPKLKALAEKSAFQPTRHIVEIHGLCQTCDIEPRCTS
ncbi:MAG: Fur family transcriptional regulator [Sulfitobacter sp.]